MRVKNRFLGLLKKEIYYNFLISPLGFVFIVLFSLIAVWLFFQDFFVIAQAEITSLFNIIPFLFLFFLPAITMNLFAEEKKSKTWEIILTLPFSEKEIVLAKFLAALIFAATAVMFTLPLAVIVKILGTPDLGIIISGYFAIILIAAAYISAGVFFSSVTNNPIVAFLATIFFLLVNFFIGQNAFLSRLPTMISNIISSLSLNYHFNLIARGNIPLSSLIFYFSWIFIFVWLTIVSLKSRDH